MKSSFALWLMLPILLVLWGMAVWGSNADAIWVDEWWTTYYSGWGSNADAIWVDEWWTTYYSGSSPNSDITTIAGTIDRVATNRTHENNPVGYYIIMHVWKNIVGRSDVAMRLFSSLCSLLTVALIYRLGRVIGGVKVGLAAAVILAFSAFFVNYSHELRMYALAAMWGALGLLSYWKFMHLPESSPVWGGALLISAAGLIYTHYGNAILVALLGLYHLVIGFRQWQTQRTTAQVTRDKVLIRQRLYQQRWWQALGIAITAGLLFLPHLPLTLGIGFRFTEKLTTDDIVQEGIWPLPDVLRMTLMGFANEQILFLLIFAAALAFVFWPRETRVNVSSLPPRVHEGLMLSGMLSLGGILMLLALRLAFQTVFHVRYLLVVWLPLSLFCALIITQALQRIRADWRTPAASLLLVGWIGVGLALSADIRFHGAYVHPVFRSAFTEPDRWDELGAQLKRDASPVDAVAVSAGNEVLAWAHRGDAEYYIYDTPARLLLLEGDKTNPADFRDFVHGASRVWLARSLTQELSPLYTEMERVVDAEGYQACGDPQTEGNISLTIYSVVPQCCEAPETVLGTFGDAAELRYHQATVKDDLLHIWQGWQIHKATPNTDSIGWYVFDEAGEVSTQADRALMAPGYSCILAEIPLTEEVAQLRLGVYDWSTQIRLPLTSTGEAADNLLTLPIDPS